MRGKRKNSENSGDGQPRGTGPLQGPSCGRVDVFFFFNVFLVLLPKRMSSLCNWYIFVGYFGTKYVDVTDAAFIGYEMGGASCLLDQSKHGGPFSNNLSSQLNSGLTCFLKTSEVRSRRRGNGILRYF